MQCAYCEITDKNVLAICKTCNQHFCNNQDSPQQLSHILKHIKETKHNIFDFPNKCKLYCQQCGKRDITSLLIDNQNIILCDLHKNDACITLVQNNKIIYNSFLQRMKVKNWKPTSNGLNISNHSENSIQEQISKISGKQKEISLENENKNEKCEFTQQMKDDFEEELICQLIKFFKLTEKVSNVEFIQRYENSKDEKQPIWSAVGKRLNIEELKAYKYFTNTWTKNNKEKWPKKLKQDFKQQLIQQINLDFRPDLDFKAYRRQIQKVFYEDQQIHTKYKQYHVDSLSMYLNNVILTQISKLADKYKSKTIKQVVHPVKQQSFQIGQLSQQVSQEPIQKRIPLIIDDKTKINPYQQKATQQISILARQVKDQQFLMSTNYNALLSFQSQQWLDSWQLQQSKDLQEVTNCQNNNLILTNEQKVLDSGQIKQSANQNKDIDNSINPLPVFACFEKIIYFYFQILTYKNDTHIGAFQIYFFIKFFTRPIPKIIVLFHFRPNSASKIKMDNIFKYHLIALKRQFKYQILYNTQQTTKQH